MSEEQLTVAELLARAGNSGDGTPRRRRRRSLDEGGISVAELTGSIPAVKESPKASRHSNEPLDADEAPRPATAAPNKEETEQEDQAAKDNESTPAQEAGETQQGAVEKPQEVAAEAKAEDAVEPKSAVTQDDAPTGVMPQVEGRSLADETDIIEVVPDDAEAEGETAEQEVADEEVSAEAPAEVQEGVLETDFSDPEAVPSAAEVLDHPQKMSVLGVIIMIVAAVIGGAAVFKGFEMLWEYLNVWITGLLAVTVVAAMVGAVHALRTDRDRMSMFLAFLAGVAITFGPALITAFS